MYTKTETPKILVLGAGGMLGSTLFKYFCEKTRFQTLGTLKTNSKIKYFSPDLANRLVCDVDVNNKERLNKLFQKHKPDIVINCIGIIKQLDAARNHLMSLAINSVLPHQLALLCQEHGSRLVHLSTDCVFSGDRGMYLEADFPDANDLYGRSKFLGEVDYPHAITLRTSIIGHELETTNSLVNWFLSQTGTVKGFKRAVFSGLPTVEIARIIHDHVIPNPDLSGLYQVSADPIDKFTLLTLVAKIYGKRIEILSDESLEIDRSLDSRKFRQKTGFSPKPWPELIKIMHQDALANGVNNVRK